MGAFSTAHHAQLCIHTWAMHDLHSVTPQKVTRCSLPWYTVSSMHHLDFVGKINAIWLISSKLKLHLLSLTKTLYFRFYSSRRSTHRVVNAQLGDLPTLN